MREHELNSKKSKIRVVFGCLFFLQLSKDRNLDPSEHQGISLSYIN